MGCRDPDPVLRDLLRADAATGPAETAVRSGQPLVPPTVEAACSWWPGQRVLSDVTGLRAVRALPLVFGDVRVGALVLLGHGQDPVAGGRAPGPGALASAVAELLAALRVTRWNAGTG